MKHRTRLRIQNETQHEPRHESLVPHLNRHFFMNYSGTFFLILMTLRQVLLLVSLWIFFPHITPTIPSGVCAVIFQKHLKEIFLEKIVTNL